MALLKMNPSKTPRAVLRKMFDSIGSVGGKAGDKIWVLSMFINVEILFEKTRTSSFAMDPESFADSAVALTILFDDLTNHIVNEIERLPHQ